jgi:uncharacterized cupredoxin-like copper-binding protein
MSPTATSTNGKTIDPVSEAPTGKGQLEAGTEERLRAVETEVRNQGRTVRKAQRAWGLFAFFALLIAAGNLIAVAAKLDGKSDPVPAAATPAAVPAAQAPAPATPGKVAVTLKEFSVNPAATQAPAGRVTFNVRNSGAVRHEFVVLRTDKPAGSLLKGAEADEAGNVGEIGDLPPGSLKTVALKLKAGHYALVCNLPGHYSAGQHADFTVK